MKDKNTFSVSEFKSRSLGLFARISKSGESIFITKRGKPIAKVIPMAEEIGPPQAGRLAGTVLYEHDIVSPLGASLWNAAKR